MGTAGTRFEDPVVWQKAHPFVRKVYRLTRTFPRSEIYALSSQFRRAAVSIAANIAEGFKNVEKQTNSAISTSPKGPSRSLATT